MTRFPILGTKETIPLALIEPHERQAVINHGQSLRRLADRGGLDWVEAWYVLNDRDWPRRRDAVVDMTSAERHIRALIDL